MNEEIQFSPGIDILRSVTEDVLRNECDTKGTKYLVLVVEQLPNGGALHHLFANHVSEHTAIGAMVYICEGLQLQPSKPAKILSEMSIAKATGK